MNSIRKSEMNSIRQWIAKLGLGELMFTSDNYKMFKGTITTDLSYSEWLLTTELTLLDSKRPEIRLEYLPPYLERLTIKNNTIRRIIAGDEIPHLKSIEVADTDLYRLTLNNYTPALRSVTITNSPLEHFDMSMLPIHMDRIHLESTSLKILGGFPNRFNLGILTAIDTPIKHIDLSMVNHINRIDLDFPIKSIL